ncbi:hypothetical protein E0Z06_09785 [Rheinheimera sp. D18]|uniref:hypothetical protein n=1 Tax=Rheinheimera sp. D18 TaxID=2545632 RepID=UPI0010501F8F|nr:hypothetical protein [Rheinheimera sp. D18]QBL09786.1 hypothetical protein E0Z06_09785 [Rheinheimera sp. D18]
MLTRAHLGIALVQVLLITGILAALLMIAVGHTQMQQKQVLALQQQLQHKNMLYSQTNELIFNLLTEPLVNQTNNDNTLLSQWNFYGSPFVWQNSDVRLFNLPSLINLQADFAGLQQLLQYHGKPQHEAEAMVQQIKLRQNPFLQRDRLSHNAVVLPVQHLTELANLPHWDRYWQRRVAPFVTLVPFAGNSPAYIPSAMLDLLFSAPKADMIRVSRNNAVLSAEQFFSLADLVPDDFTLMTPGPYLRLELQCCADTSAARQIRQVDIELRPYGLQPLQFLSITDHQ